MNTEEKQPVLNPHVVSSGTVPASQLYQEIADGTTFQQGEIEGIMDAVIHKMIAELKNGKTVELGKLGYFSLKITSRPVTDKQSIHAQSISFKNVNFRSSAWLKDQLSVLSFVRAQEGYQASVDTSIEFRKQTLENYLAEHPFITRTEYTRLTGLLKNKALAELNSLVKEGYLETHGRGSHKIYVKK
ncbi:MAG: HU family DNA-binding protein [Tannerellaceae bacterium]|nr:HU family DNA-binding protein [Tannerellaceae bacterium]